MPSVAATTLWILGSMGFTTYVSKVGSYDKTYGSLGGVIVLLLWFYLTARLGVRALCGNRRLSETNSVLSD
jgi:YihY family inner membrane protein